jgi:hypothetical protein
VTHTRHLLPFPWHIYYILAISVTHTRQLLPFPWHTYDITIYVTYKLRCWNFRDTRTLLQFPWCIQVCCCHFCDTYTYFLGISVTYTYVVAIFLPRRRKLLTLASRCLSVLPSQDSSDFFSTPGTLKMRFNSLNCYN